MNNAFLCFFFFVACLKLTSQTGLVNGQVYDAANGNKLAFVNIEVNDGEYVIETDSSGFFRIELPAGFHNLSFSFLSYETYQIFQVKSDPVKPNYLDIPLQQSSEQLDEVVIAGGIFNKTLETPHSIRSIGINEINRFPGTTLDVSKVVKNLPGVLPKVSFGYNIIVRGGGSFENRFFIDGIEIPSINHFSVQGVAGGPNGIINMDLLRGADLISGAFPANRYNTLSSVLDLHTREARKDKLGMRFTLGATDVGVTLEGPLSNSTDFILSARKSFSEFYLKAFSLPVLPAYSDYNFRVRSKWKNNELKFIGIGGFDRSRLNLEDAESEDASEALLYNIGYIPEGRQSVHTFGLNYKRYGNKSYSSVILSRSFFNNEALKYFDNTFEAQDLSLDYKSTENVYRIRMERKVYDRKLEYAYGISGEWNSVNMDNFSIRPGRNLFADTLDVNAFLNYGVYGAFISASYKALDDKLKLFAGIRADGSNYGKLTRNMLKQFSPRLSLSYDINNKTTISSSVGRYFQLPPNIIMSYSENNSFVNRDQLSYIQSDQIDLSLRVQPNSSRLYSATGYYKLYSDYPFLLNDSISFANANADYVSVGNQLANSISSGRAYGLELLVQQKFNSKSVWTANYHYSVSEFSDASGELTFSSWDTRHVFNILWSRTLRNNWQIGFKFNYASGSRYTPFDLDRSSNINFWELNRRGVFDYDQLNQAQLRDFHQLDFRVDKNFYFNKWTLNLFLDIQNLYSSPIEFIPYLTPLRNGEGNFAIDPDNPDRYLMNLVSSDSGRVLPTIGVIIEL